MDIIEKPEMELAIRDINITLDIRMPNQLMAIENIEIGYDGVKISDIPTEILIEKDQKIAIIGKN